MNQGTQGYSFTKKTEGRKSRDTVSLMPSKLLHKEAFPKSFTGPMENGKSFLVTSLIKIFTQS
jgi:hypothetical protein